MLSLLQTPEATQYTPTSETDCIDNQCSQKLYPQRVFKEESGNWLTVTELTHLDTKGETFNLTGSNWFFAFEPYVTYNGKETSIPELQAANPSITDSKTKETHRFNHKFTQTISNIPTLSASAMTEMSYKFKSNAERIKTTKNSVVINDNIEVSFQDLIDTNYKIKKLTNESIVLESLQITNGKMELDPIVQLNYSDIAIDYHFLDQARGGDPIILMRFSIVDIPILVNITNSTLWLRETCTFLCPPTSGTDLNLTRIDNQTWTLSDNPTGANGLNKQLTNETNIDWFSEDGSFPTNNIWWLANVNAAVVEDYNQGNNFTSFWLEDRDNDYNDYTGFKIDGQSLSYGRSFNSLTFASLQKSDVSMRPYILIEYEHEELKPNVTNWNYIPEQNVSPWGGNHQNFTCNASDNVELYSIEVYGDFLNSSWQRMFWNFDSGLKQNNVTWYFNLSEYFDGQDAWSSNLTSSNGRSITNNGTHWIISSYGSDITRIHLLNGVNITQWDNYDSWIIDIDTNETNITYIDVLSETVYFSDMQGALTGQCNVADDGYPFGIAYDTDNQTLWITWENATEYIEHINADCTHIEQWELPNGNPESLTIWNDKAFYDDSFPFPNEIRSINLTDGTTNTEVVDYRTKLDLSVDDSMGLWMNESERFEEELWLTTNSPSELTVLRRWLNSSELNYACMACDIYNNCNLTDNTTFYVRSTTSSTSTSTTTSSTSTSSTTSSTSSTSSTSTSTTSTSLPYLTVENAMDIIVNDGIIYNWWNIILMIFMGGFTFCLAAILGKVKVCN